jgi:hypothetical protein
MREGDGLRGRFMALEKDLVEGRKENKEITKSDPGCS